MKKEYFLKQLAKNGYNVIYGAKKHFATYDMVTKIPGRTAFITLAIGIWQVYSPNFQYNTEVSLLLILASILALIVSQYNAEKDKYRITGNQLIQIHNDLRELYYLVKSSKQNKYTNESPESIRMNELLEQYYESSISKQIFLSDWLAHYKLFAQGQYEWIDEQKKFTWKDKIPLSFLITMISLIIITTLLYILLCLMGYHL